MTISFPLKHAAADEHHGDIPTTRAERLAVIEFERAEQRRQRQEEQRLHTNTPEARVRAWEKLHGLSLPSTPGHPVLGIVCSATGLGLTEVQEVQHLRAARRAARV
jgi:hypothetical protein